MELIIKSHQRSLCSRTSQWNFNDNFVSPTTVQFLILFNFHITILDTFNEENLTLDKPVIYRDEEIGQTGRNRFTRGIKWVRKGPGANFVGFYRAALKIVIPYKPKKLEVLFAMTRYLNKPVAPRNCFQVPKRINS